MKNIGITGGIGSGKTTVCKIFESLGIPVYYADTRAKALVTENKKLVSEIKKLLGDAAYLPDGTYNRKYVADIVFNDTTKLQQLNALIHPAVAIDGIEWHKVQHKVPYSLKEAALMVESGSYKSLDLLISVWAPRQVRIERVMQRDGVTKQEVEARMAKQLPEFEKIKVADFVIINDGNSSLIEQVVRLHRKFVR